MNLLDNFDGVRRGALLRAHLHELAVFLLRADQECAFAGVVAAGFFNVDVFAGLQAQNRHRRMPVIGRGDRNGVNFFQFEHLAEVLICFGAAAHHFFRGGGKFGHDVGFHIADIGDIRCRLIGFQRRQMRVGAAVEANHGEVEALVGAHDLPVALCGVADSEAGCAHSKCVEKFPSRDHLFSYSSIERGPRTFRNLSMLIRPSAGVRAGFRGAGRRIELELG